MIRKVPSPKSDCVRIIFELPACIWADRIFLVGEFNDWDATVTPFTQSRDGIWQAIADLAAGRDYQFRYLVDGAWQTDFHADGWAINEYGSQNSIVSATLPPGALPTVGETSLLHEALRDVGHTNRTSETLRPTPRAVTERSGRFFPPPTRAAG